VLDILATLQALDRSLDEAEGRAPPEWAPTDIPQPITRS
jgi:hypothetical protein